MNPIQVVAAVIERDGRILIGQRRADKSHPLKWEFPGGKVESGEDSRDALARELREELAIDAKIGELLESYEFRYKETGPATLLLFYRVTEFSGEPQNLDFAQILWETRQNLPSYDFLEGDVAFLARLAY
ncbi:MAG: (deoxy)nucleoside triphosphate pyrophosphohydrolase [Acidobacteriota bacterium]